jgi:hypothetical protein
LKQIKTPQTFMYVAKIPAAKKIKSIVFRQGVPVSVHDPKIIRMVARLPYMRAVEDATDAPSIEAKPYVWRDPATIPTRAESAKAASLADMPDDWRGQHWKRRISWAKAISGDVVTSASDADRIIAAHRGEPATVEA